MSTKPTVLILISTYLPGERAGGPVRTISNMVEWIGEYFDFRILTADRDIGDAASYPSVIPKQWQQVGKAHVRYLAPHEQSLLQLRDLIRTIPHDILYINSVFPKLSMNALLLYRFRLVPQNPIVIAPRGQWRPEAMQLKACKKRAFMAVTKLVGLYHNLTWHASNADEKSDIEREVGAANVNRIEAISNLPIRLQLVPKPFVKREKSSGVAKIAFLSRIVNKKNLDYLLHCMTSLSGQLQLDIYGAIEDPVYWKKCAFLIERLPDNVRANYCGVVPFNQVLNVLSQYHLFVLPTLSENFGQVIVEALVAGCPVLISDRTPWDDVATDGAGWVLPLENPMAWQCAIQEMLDMAQSHFDIMAAKAQHYGKTYCTHSHPADKLRELLIGMIRSHSA